MLPRSVARSLVPAALLVGGVGVAASWADEGILPEPPPIQSLRYRAAAHCGTAGESYEHMGRASQSEYAGDLSEAKLTYEYHPGEPHLWTVWQWNKFSKVAERYEAQHTDRLEGDIIMHGNKIKVVRFQEHGGEENDFKPFRRYYPSLGTEVRPIGKREEIEGYSGLNEAGGRSEWWMTKSGDSWLPYEFRETAPDSSECVTRIDGIQINGPIDGKPFLHLDDPKFEISGLELNQGIPNAPVPETLHFVETTIFKGSVTKETRIVDGNGVNLRTEFLGQDIGTGKISYHYVTLITPDWTYGLQLEKKTGERKRVKPEGAFGGWQYLQQHIDDYYPGKWHRPMTNREWLIVRHVGTEDFKGEQVEVYEASGNFNGVEGQEYEKRWLLAHTSGWWLPRQYIFNMKSRKGTTVLEDVRINEHMDLNLFTVPENYTIVDK